MPVYKGSTEIVPSPPGNYNPLGEELAIFKGEDVVYAMMPVSFDEQGGSTVSDKDVYYNSIYGSLPTSTRSYYDLDGWFTASSGGSQILSTTTVTDTFRHTLYAQWSPNDTGYYVSVSDNTLDYDQTSFATGNYYPGAEAPTAYYWDAPYIVSGNIQLTNTTSSTVSMKNTNTTGTTDGGYIRCRYTVDGNYIYKMYSITLYSADLSASDWVYLGTSGYTPDINLSLNSGDFVCPTTTESDNYLTSTYPPSNYNIGVIAQVATYRQTLSGETFCTYHYFEAQ